MKDRRSTSPDVTVAYLLEPEPKGTIGALSIVVFSHTLKMKDIKRFFILLSLNLSDFKTFSKPTAPPIGDRKSLLL